MRVMMAAVVLTAVYALALASANPWDLAMGAILSLVVLSAFREFIFAARPFSLAETARGLARFPALVAAVSLDVVRGTIDVARAVLSPTVPESADFVDLPIGDRTPQGVVISGLLDTLSPGSVLIDIDTTDGAWTIHTLDAADPDAVRANAERLYQRFQRPIWP
jgi:multisubunit Na+/H+ antiporter MnhE subunit